MSPRLRHVYFGQLLYRYVNRESSLRLLRHTPTTFIYNHSGNSSTSLDMNPKHVKSR